MTAPHITPETSLKIKIVSAIACVFAIIGGAIGGTWWTANMLSGKADKTELQAKADKKDLDNLALTVSTLASKEEVKGVVSAVAALTDKLNEWRAVQREDAVKLDTIKTIVVEMKDNQKWQIQQEVDRKQWQSFKPDPPPPANVKQ